MDGILETPRTWTFWVAMEPVGKQRPVFNAKQKRAVTPDKTKKGEEYIKEAFLEVFPGFTPLEGAVGVDVCAFKFNGDDKVGLPWIEVPDTDNIAKLVLDALNGVAYKDDAQVTVLGAEKMEYVEAPCEQGLSVMIYEREV